MQIYVNLIILSVPCVFSLELGASRDQRETDRFSERDRDLIRHIEPQMNRKQRRGIERRTVLQNDRRQLVEKCMSHKLPE